MVSWVGFRVSFIHLLSITFEKNCCDGDHKMSFHDELRVLRRFLRDPEGNIWDNDLLRELYNAVQADLQAKTGVLEEVRALSLPPRLSSSYLYDWEWAYADEPAYLALHAQGDHLSFSARFEIQVAAGIGGDTNDKGHGFTHPFEAWMGITPGSHVEQPFPENFHSAKAVYYDNEPLDYTTRKRVTTDDHSWTTRSGEPQWYFRNDDVDNEFVLYPRPDTVAWNDQTTEVDTIAVYAAAWESDYAGDDAAQFTSEDSTAAYVFPWEDGILASVYPWMRGMWLFETDFSSGGLYGQVLYISGETQGNQGTIIASTDRLLSGDLGIAVDAIDTDDNLLLVYDISPTEIVSLGDESDWPEYLRRYVRYGTLERAYRSNNDGRIESLSRYWGARYELGTQAVQRYMSRRKEDRDYRLATQRMMPVRRKRLPRLPARYPAVNP